MSDWLDTALVEAKAQLEVIEKTAGLQHPDLIGKLDRYANLLRQKGQINGAINMEARAKVIRSRYTMKSTKEEKTTPGKKETPTPAKSDHRGNKLGTGGAFIGALSAMFGRTMANDYPRESLAILAWFCLTLAAIVIGVQAGKFFCPSGKKNKETAEKLAIGALFLWIFPFLGLVYGSMTNTICKTLNISGKHSIFSKIGIALSLINSGAGIAMSVMHHG